MYNFKTFIYSLLLITIFPLSSNALDGAVGLRCDETYSFKMDSLCFPADAVLQPDGSCECPADGCKECPISDGLVDYYCEKPINLLSKVADPIVKFPFEILIRRHYERWLYSNSCGNRDKKGMHWGTCFAWFTPIYTVSLSYMLATPLAPFYPGAVVSATTATCGGIAAQGKKSGYNNEEIIKVKFDKKLKKEFTDEVLLDSKCKKKCQEKYKKDNKGGIKTNTGNSKNLKINRCVRVCTNNQKRKEYYLKDETTVYGSEKIKDYEIDKTHTGNIGISAVYISDNKKIAGSYGIQPRLEIVDFINQQGNLEEKIPIIRFYFTQRDKYDYGQYLINLDSKSSSEGYFHFRDKDFSQNLYAGSHMWRSLKFCEEYDHENTSKHLITDEYPQAGVKCQNGPYLRGLLVNKNNPTHGIKLPPNGTEPFFPIKASYYKGGIYKIVAKPKISWSLNKASTFTNPIINVKFKDSEGNEKDSTKEINSLETDVNHNVNDSSWKYQMAIKIEDNDNLQKSKKLCLYVCKAHFSGNHCLKPPSLENIRGNFSVLDFIQHEDNNIRTEAKLAFLTKPNDNSEKPCVDLPDIKETNAIEVTGLGIGSTYDNPKIKFTITENSKTTQEAIYSLGNKQDIEDILNMKNDITCKNDQECHKKTEDKNYVCNKNTSTCSHFSYNKNNEIKNLFMAHSFTIRQDLKLDNSKFSNSLDSCRKDTDCLDGYKCIKKDINKDTQNINCDNNSKTCYCRSLNYKFCNLYNNCDQLDSLGEKDKSFICLRNISNIAGVAKPTEDNPYLVHPYNISNKIIKNDIVDYDSSAKQNLCIPAPQKIISLTYTEKNNDINNPVSDINIKYLTAKPFIEYGDKNNPRKATDQGEEKDQTIIPDYKGPASGSSKTEKIIRFDYHHNLKFIFENNNGLYCVYVQRYNYANEVWEASGLEDTKNLTRIGDKYRIGVCKNLNRCQAGDAGILRAKFPEVKAGITIIGQCIIKQMNNSKTPPKAFCNQYGKWEISKDSGECVNNCPAKLPTINQVHNDKNYSINFPHTQSNNKGDKSVTATTNCQLGYKGTVTVTDQCQDNGKWKNNYKTSHNCTVNTCSGSFNIGVGGSHSNNVGTMNPGTTTTRSCAHFGVNGVKKIVRSLHWWSGYRTVYDQSNVIISCTYDGNFKIVNNECRANCTFPGLSYRFMDNGTVEHKNSGIYNHGQYMFTCNFYNKYWHRRAYQCFNGTINYSGTGRAGRNMCW